MGLQKGKDGTWLDHWGFCDLSSNLARLPSCFPWSSSIGYDLGFGGGKRGLVPCPIPSPPGAWLASLPAPHPPETMVEALIRGQVSAKLMFAAGRNSSSQDEGIKRPHIWRKGEGPACVGREQNSTLLPLACRSPPPPDSLQGPYSFFFFF